MNQGDIRSGTVRDIAARQACSCGVHNLMSDCDPSAVQVPAHVTRTSGVLLLQTMSSSPVAAWSALIKGLKVLVKSPTDTNGAAYKAALVQFDTVIKAHQRMTRAAWKRLVKENKVS